MARVHVLLTLSVWLVVSLLPSIAQFVYATNGGGSSNVSAYSITTEGALEAVPDSPFPAGDLPASIAIEIKKN